MTCEKTADHEASGEQFSCIEYADPREWCQACRSEQRDEWVLGVASAAASEAAENAVTFLAQRLCSRLRSVAMALDGQGEACSALEALAEEMDP
jgi:hypothetical protein